MGDQPPQLSHGATPRPLGVIRPPQGPKKFNLILIIIFLIWPLGWLIHPNGHGGHFGQTHFKNKFFLAQDFPNILFNSTAEDLFNFKIFLLKIFKIFLLKILPKIFKISDYFEDLTADNLVLQRFKIFKFYCSLFIVIVHL
jgi:hypothetical protein